MRTKDDWRYIARLMKMKGWTLSSIRKTLKNLGHDIPLSTLSDNLNLMVNSQKDMPEGYLEWMQQGQPQFTSPCALDLDALGVAILLDPDRASLSPADSEICPRNALIVEGYSHEMGDEFTFYSPSKRHKNGLKAYLERERRENRKAEDISDVLGVLGTPSRRGTGSGAVRRLFRQTPRTADGSTHPEA